MCHSVQWLRFHFMGQTKKSQSLLSSFNLLHINVRQPPAILLDSTSNLLPTLFFFFPFLKRRKKKKKNPSLLRKFDFLGRHPMRWWQRGKLMVMMTVLGIPSLSFFLFFSHEGLGLGTCMGPIHPKGKARDLRVPWECWVKARKFDCRLRMRLEFAGKKKKKNNPPCNIT